MDKQKFKLFARKKLDTWVSKYGDGEGELS